MITRENDICLEKFVDDYSLKVQGNRQIYKDSIFFDLEHYVYKKPVCIGVFGCCYYDESCNALKVTQYMIEDKNDSLDVLHLSKEYFQRMFTELNKKYIVTFSGNNDFIVINYLLEKYNIDFKIDDYYTGIDLQKEYEKEKKSGIGLKNLEKEFGIIRDSELISGSNLAKTFSKIIKDSDYIKRMPSDKKEKILLYNEQDVVSLFHIFINWEKVIKDKEE